MGVPLSGPPKTILYGTLAASVCSAFITSVVSTLRGKARIAPALAATAALNTGIAASTFFGIREYAVTPVLQARLKPPSAPGNEANSLSHLGSHKIIDSAVSGMVTGSLLNAWRHGRRSILSGALTAGLFCSALQFAFNQAMIARLRMISDSESPVDAPVSDIPKRMFLEEMVSSIGFNRMSEDQYLAALKNTRDGHLRRIKELENEIERGRESQRDADTHKDG